MVILNCSKWFNLCSIKNRHLQMPSVLAVPQFVIPQNHCLSPPWAVAAGYLLFSQAWVTRPKVEAAL